MPLIKILQKPLECLKLLRDHDSEGEQEADQDEDDKLNPDELDVDLGTIDFEENMMLFEVDSNQKSQTTKDDKAKSKTLKANNANKNHTKAKNSKNKAKLLTRP